MPPLLLLLAVATAAVPGPTGPITGEAAAPATPATPAAPALGARLAPPPTAAEVNRWSATEYNSFLVDNQFAVLSEIRRAVDVFTAASDPQAYVTYEQEVRGAALAGLANVRALPPRKGDPAFRDAIASAYEVMVRIFEDDLPQIWALAAKEDVHDADLAALEALIARTNADANAADAAVIEAQKAFARKEGFILLKSDASVLTPTPVPEFEAPGLPPAGSLLSAAVHVGFAMRYHNRFVGRQVRLVEAANSFMEATGGADDALEAARTRALAVVREELAALRADEAWQGDDSLRLGLLACAEPIEALLDEDFATYSQLRTKAALNRKEVDRLNAIAAASGPKLQKAIDTFSIAQSRFQARWALAEYEAWLRAQGRLPSP